MELFGTDGNRATGHFNFDLVGMGGDVVIPGGMFGRARSPDAATSRGVITVGKSRRRGVLRWAHALRARGVGDAAEAPACAMLVLCDLVAVADGTRPPERAVWRCWTRRRCSSCCAAT